MRNNFLALGGAVVGGVLGYFAFFLIAAQGLYGLVLPGGLLGLGAGVVKNRSVLVSIVCGISAVALGLFTEYSFSPFIRDDSLGYFLSHVTELRPITLGMIAVGGCIGFYVPFRRKVSSSTV